jgi:hypothetical protein
MLPATEIAIDEPNNPLYLAWLFAGFSAVESKYRRPVPSTRHNHSSLGLSLSNGGHARQYGHPGVT